MSRPLTIALAGNPNSGKTTVFNALTGARQHVGNYPGVTVEKKEGTLHWRGRTLHLVDLPGTYSLAADSPEELVARDYLIEERPDVVIDVVDASNLERNLYLTVQLMELDAPLVVALNMMDAAEAQGKEIDDALLGRLLGAPMVQVVASRSTGIEELLEAAVKRAEEGAPPAQQVSYGEELELHLSQLARTLEKHPRLGRLSPRWAAMKLLEGDPQVQEALFGDAPDGLREQVRAARAHIREVVGDDPETALADRRYGFITGARREAVSGARPDRRDWSETIDQVALSRVFGMPVFLGLMWLMFWLVFQLGVWPMHWLEHAFSWLGVQVGGLMAEGALRSLIVDGVIGGVGGVLVFVPNIALLFIALALLEDSGYMARAAFVVDRVMHKIGLHGRSFIPLLIGLGCTVPAVLAARTLANRRDRLVTILVTPLMSCGARLPVYILLAGAFFPERLAGHVIFSLYLLGGLLAIGMAKLFRTWVFCGPNEPFVMELPPYRTPTLKGVLIHAGERAGQYVRKAGTVILAASIVMWFLLSHPTPPPQQLQGLSAPQVATLRIEHSYAGAMGRAIEPAVRPLGFDWRGAVSLVSGLTAKEVIVSTLGTLYSLGGKDAGPALGTAAQSADKSENLRRALRESSTLTPLSAYAFMVFVLLYVPCLASLAVIARETGSWRWALLAASYTLVLAWLAAFVIYQGGRLVGLG